MKRIVFHSYKGGVGRSLAAANFGYALSRIGKKVVMLDLDVDAPSLHLKLGLERVSSGYIDYLKEYYEPIEDKGDTYTVVNSVMDASIKERSASLQKYTIDISKNLKLIPAGDASSNIYWWNLGSTWLHFLLSLTREEIAKVENGYAISATLSRDFLGKELKVISGLYGANGADYLIIDCRSPREYSSVALIFWANIVVSMFHANSDGLRGAANINHFVQRAWPEPQKHNPSKASTLDLNPGRIIPVLCRVPETFSQDPEKVHDLEQRLMAYWEQIQIPSGRIINPPEPFVTLHEFRDLEQTERLLLQAQPKSSNSGRRTVRDIDRLLSHDYVKLFTRIFAGEKDMARGLPLRETKIWNVVLGLKEDVIAEGSSFEFLANGIMLNRDYERNVALRAETVRGWLASFRENDDFHTIGYAWGNNFGRELVQPEHVFKSVPTDISELLAGWCEFDYRAGFGRMDYKYDPTDGSGKIIWKDNFLDDKKKRRPYLTQFACGYIRGVLENLLPNSIGGVSIRPIGTTVFNFSKISSVRTGKKLTKKLVKRDDEKSHD
jgi:MinD-like ATPase involved in chromosome partitioning or flagellar assembly